MKKYIRANIPQTDNEYHEFIARFHYGKGVTTLKISSETDYCAYINGALVGYGQYGDLINYKVYDEIDITRYLRKGENVLAVRAYFEHKFNAHYVEKGTGLAFEISCGENILCESDENVLSRLSRAYKSGEVPLITRQLGYSYFYDFEREDLWINGDVSEGFSPSVVLNRRVEWHPRPIKKLVEKRNGGRIIRVGSFEDGGQFDTAGEKMQRAELCERETDFVLPSTDGMLLRGKDDKDNIYMLADIGDEVSGLLTFDIEVPEPCSMSVAYGEHIADGRIRSLVIAQSFTFEFRLKAGRNRFTGHFRRLGAKFVSAFLYCPQAKIYDFGILSTEYPVIEKAVKFEDERLKEIYATGVKTLKVCMHEHYEDTPWREQGLYAMDARNEMLSCAYAFEDWAEFARASLDLMSRSVRGDDVFTITTPTTLDENDINIPSFSLIQFLLMRDYMKLSGDKSLFIEHEKTYRRVLDNFIARRDENGLIKPFSERRYWNFYDWVDELDGAKAYESGITPDRYDAPLTALFLAALQSMKEMLESVSRYAGEYDEKIEKAECAVNMFFDEERGVFADFIYPNGGKKHYSELGNSLCALVSKNEKYVAAALDALSRPSDMIPITLSHSIFKFEALLGGGEQYRDCVVNEIKRVWGKMLDEGASTFYEVADNSMFGGSSLSHGWSAVPVYILRKYGFSTEQRR